VSPRSGTSLSAPAGARLSAPGCINMLYSLLYRASSPDCASSPGPALQNQHTTLANNLVKLHDFTRHSNPYCACTPTLRVLTWPSFADKDLNRPGVSPRSGTSLSAPAGARLSADAAAPAPPAPDAGMRWKAAAVPLKPAVMMSSCCCWSSSSSASGREASAVGVGRLGAAGMAEWLCYYACAKNESNKLSRVMIMQQRKRL
jgi:hypothetical protein